MLEKIAKIIDHECLTKIVISFLSASQAMLAMTASLLPVKKILDKTVQFNICLYIIGLGILFLLFVVLTMITSSPIIVSFISLSLLNIIAAINYYEFIYHGTVLTHQDIGNIGTALHHLGNYKLEIDPPIMIIIFSFLVLQLFFALLSKKGNYISFKPERRDYCLCSIDYICL